MAMNGIVPPETEAALVAWVNSFQISGRVGSLSEMNDGKAMWEMLREINRDEFSSELPSNKPSDYSRQQNHQFIYEQMTSYLDSQDARYSHLEEYDIRKTAMDDSISSITKFLKLVLLIVLNPPNAEVIAKMQTLPYPTPQTLHDLITEIAPSLPSYDDEDEPEIGDLGPGRKPLNGSGYSSPAGKRDREFILEEELAKVKSKLVRREAEITDLTDSQEEISEQYQRLRDSYEAVKKLSTENEEQVKKLRSEQSERELWSQRDLDAKISQQEETIGYLESQIAEYQLNESERQRKANRLGELEVELQGLRDEFGIQKKELERQTKIANTAENWKKKVHALQNGERERDSCRRQLEEAQTKLQAFDEIRQEKAKLQIANHEIGRTLSNSEQANSDLRLRMERYQLDNNALRRELKGTREALTRGQETLADFQDISRGSDIHWSPTVVEGGLESELAETSKLEDQMQVPNISLFWTRVLTMVRKSRIVELEKQNHQMASEASEKETKLITLQHRLDNVHESSADREKLSAAEKEIEAISNERTSSFENHCELTNHYVDLLEDVHIDKPKNDEEIKKRYAMALTQLQSEIDALRSKNSILRGQLTNQMEDRNQAWYEAHEAVEAKALADVENEASRQGFVELKDLIKQFSTTNSAESSDRMTVAWERNVDIFATKIEEGRERLAKQQQQIEKQDALIRALEAQLHKQKLANVTAQNNCSAFKDSKAESMPSPEERSYTKTLERELKLMASAYHDLASRLQMNNVMLQRRAEAPKSWLARQRKAAMEGVGGLVR